MDQQTLQQKFKIGDIVISKKTGSPVIGKIVGIQDPYYWLGKTNQIDAKYWTSLYPSWKDKPIYILKLTEPQKPISLTEFKQNYFDSSCSNFHVEKLYEYIPYQIEILYPEDDLELYGQ